MQKNRVMIAHNNYVLKFLSSNNNNNNNNI